MKKIKIEITELFAGNCYYRADTSDGVCLVACSGNLDSCIKRAISKSKKMLADEISSGTVIEVYDNPCPWVKRPQTLLKTITIGE